MDPALLKEREAFKRRALANPVVEKRAKKPDSEAVNSKTKVAKKSKDDSQKPQKEFNYKNMTGSSQYKFGILAKIVKYLRTRHQQGDMEPLSIDEILDETNQLDITARQQHWLVTEALMNNPKVEVVDGDKYKFKPVLNVHDRKGLLKLLSNNDAQGLGGVLVEEVEESVPHAAKALRVLSDQVVRITRPIDKKQVLFYDSKELRMPIGEEIQKLWRSVAVDGVDERNIEEYLQRHSIVTMQDHVMKKAVKNKRAHTSRRPRQFKAHNDHLGGVLEDYSEKLDK